MSPERYGVYWVDLGPLPGRGTAKKRPAVVLSDDAMNRSLKTVLVCPLTTRIHPRWPSRVQTVLDGKEAEIAVDQIRTVDGSRLAEKISGLSPSTAAELRHVITLMYGVLAV